MLGRPPDARQAYPVANSRNGLLYILDIQVPGSCDGVANAILNVVCHFCGIQLGQVCLDQVCIDTCSYCGCLQPTNRFLLSLCLHLVVTVRPAKVCAGDQLSAIITGASSYIGREAVPLAPDPLSKACSKDRFGAQLICIPAYETK